MSDIVIKKNYPDGYSSDALEILTKMSFTNGRDLKILGSMSLRSQIYAGDYDALEYVQGFGDLDYMLNNLAKKFKKIVQDIIPINSI